MRAIADGNNPAEGLRGRSAHGGLGNMLASLRRRKWITGVRIDGRFALTDLGRRVLEQHEAKVRAWRAKDERQRAHDQALQEPKA